MVNRMKTSREASEPVGQDKSQQDRALRRIQTLSRPLTVLISIALGLAVFFPIVEIVFLLFFHQLGSPHAFLSFNEWGVNLAIGGTSLRLQDPAILAVASLTLGQRLTAAGLGGLCSGCAAVVLTHLRGLFALYSRGIVFSANNVARIKMFGLWLVATAIVTNVSGRMFVWLIGAPVHGVTNAAMTVIYGAMIYVIAHVMELGREADLERKDFI
jgi:hypothetical protein